MPAWSGWTTQPVTQVGRRRGQFLKNWPRKTFIMMQCRRREDHIFSHHFAEKNVRVDRANEVDDDSVIRSNLSRSTDILIYLSRFHLGLILMILKINLPMSGIAYRYTPDSRPLILSGRGDKMQSFMFYFRWLLTFRPNIHGPRFI